MSVSFSCEELVSVQSLFAIPSLCIPVLPHPTPTLVLLLAPEGVLRDGKHRQPLRHWSGI